MPEEKKPDAAASPAPPPAAAGGQEGAPPAKPAGPAAAPGGHKPPPPAKPAAPAATPWEGELPARMKERFGGAIQQALTYMGQNFLVVEAARTHDVLRSLKEDEQFNMLADLTAVDYPKKPQRFEILYQLYSFPRNKRMRVKTALAENEAIATVTDLWPTANWLEREVYDMFGVTFSGHPDLRRILLPEEWQGFPLRKDHHILTQDDKWVQENLGIESGQ
jgi:NADH-quinone oxidoreductase subunit C